MKALARKTLFALTAVALVAGTAACTNTESPAAVSGNAPSGSASAPTGVGAGGRAAAGAVKADPAVQALVPDAFKSKGTLQLVTDPTYAPIDFTDDQGNIVGLEPDLAVAAANKMGLKVNFNKGDFNGIIAGIQARRYDASWAAFSVTADREQQVNMVSYQNAGTAIMVKHGNPDKVAQVTDLCGKTVAAQTGTTQALTDLPTFQKQCSDAGKPQITELILPQQDNVNQAVQTGRAAAMAADNALVAYYSQLQPDLFSQVDSILVDTAPEAVIVHKEDTALAKAFKAAIDSLIADGTYGKIMGAWNLGSSKVTSAAVNPAAS
ncbi:ABC transporter substrate-binding protein [Sinomonas sp. ASV322]|uniref:ABC transporter substrate-binding protein n=1 Tax=Sinomonas sp. ASV322 TaxID=3041920 RepID=UPI0027DE64BE|nr:ABC transporter substrate-binding protein [Sinomonas sp. ASV322]MDQ4503871.1 ABC transporter substrate-binding protein [Sinomonas sp. ASV322]